MASNNSRRPNWSEKESLLLLAEFQQRKQRIEGCFVGKGGGKSDRDKAWTEIADVLNSQFLSTKRSTAEVKKKYYNIKQNTKNKSDEARRPPTGGGKGPVFSCSEEFMLTQLDGRSVLDGIPGGFDTEISEIADAMCISLAGDDPSLNDIVTQPTTNINLQAFTSDASQNDYTAAINKGRTTAEESIEVNRENVSTESSENDKITKTGRKEKRKKKTVKDMEVKVLHLEKKKLKLEIKVMKEKLKFMEAKTDFLNIKKNNFHQNVNHQK